MNKESSHCTDGAVSTVDARNPAFEREGGETGCYSYSRYPRMSILGKGIKKETEVAATNAFGQVGCGRMPCPATPLDYLFEVFFPFSDRIVMACDSESLSLVKIPTHMRCAAVLCKNAFRD